MQGERTSLDVGQTPFISTLLILAAIVIIVAGLTAARAIIIPFLLAIFIGVIISAIIEWLRKRGINTGAAIFLLMAFLLVSSLLSISVVVSSVNELAGRLPELNAVVKTQEKKIIDWLEDRGFVTELPKPAQNSSSPQSLEISVPGLVPVPEDHEDEKETGRKDEKSESGSPETNSENSETPSTPAGEASKTSQSDAPKTSDGADESSNSTPGNETNPETEPRSLFEESSAPRDETDEVGETTDETDGAGAISENPKMTEMELPEDVMVDNRLTNPFALPGYIFGEQRHVIEFSPTSPTTHVQTRQDGSLNLLSPVQIFRAFLESVLSILNYTFIVMLMLLFLMIEWSRFGKKLEALTGDSQKYVQQVREVLASIRRYMLIKTMVSLLTGLLVAIGLILLDTEYATLWGIVAFLFNYIPTIGSMIAGIVPVLYVLVDQGPWAASYVAIVFLAVNFVIGNLLEPRIMGEGLGLSTFVVFLSLIFWGWVLGPAGMLLAVPLTMVVKIALASDERTQWFALLLGSRTDMASITNLSGTNEPTTQPSSPPEKKKKTDHSSSK